MDINTFKDMLFEDKDPIETYIQSEEVQEKIILASSVSAILHIMVEKLGITNEEIEKVQEMYKKEIELRVIKKLKSELGE